MYTYTRMHTQFFLLFWGPTRHYKTYGHAKVCVHVRTFFFEWEHLTVRIWQKKKHWEPWNLRLWCCHAPIPRPPNKSRGSDPQKKRQFLILKGHPEGRWYFHHPIKLLRLYGDYVSPNIPKSWIVIPSPYNFSSYLPHQVFGNTPFSVLFCNSQCRRLWPCLGVRVEGRAGGGRSVWIWLWPMG